MKKNLFKKINLAGCFLLSTMSLTSCSLFYQSDEKTAISQFDEFLKVSDAKDKIGIVNIFSQRTIETVSDFDKQVDKFVDFYDGENSNVLAKSFLYTKANLDNNNRYAYVQYVFDKVETSTNLYIFKVEFCTDDTKNIDNEGITKLFVVKCLKNEEPQLKYDFSGWEDTDKFRGITLKTYEEMLNSNTNI